MFHTWADFVAAMERHPEDILLMKVASDWLQERDDVRWEALAWLAENGRVGEPDVGGYSYWNVSSRTRIKAHVCHEWWWTAVSTDHYPPSRVNLLDAYAAADDETCARWLRESA